MYYNIYSLIKNIDGCEEMVDEDPLGEEKKYLFTAKGFPHRAPFQPKSKLVIKRQSRDLVVILYGNIAQYNPRISENF